jgi:hypothetical protein
MIITARKIGQFIRKVVRSPIWAQIMDTSREIRELPKKMMDEVSIENDINNLKKEAQDTLNEIKQIGDEMKIPKEDLTPKFQAPPSSIPITSTISSATGERPTTELDQTLTVGDEIGSYPVEEADPEEMPVFDPFIAAGIDPPPPPAVVPIPEIQSAESLPETSQEESSEDHPSPSFEDDSWKPLDDPLAAAAGEG